MPVANSLLMGDEVLSNIMKITNNDASKYELNPTVEQMHRGSCSNNHKRYLEENFQYLSLPQGREKPRYIPNFSFLTRKAQNILIASVCLSVRPSVCETKIWSFENKI